MARKLTDQQWLDIRTKYELGDGIRAIAREYDIPHGTIQARIKKESWTQELANKISDVKTKIQEISQVAKNEQLVAIEQKLHQEIDDVMQIMKTVTNLHKGALNLHGLIVKKTIQQTQNGEMTAREASQILANTGMKVDQIHKAYVPQQPSTAIQINGNNSNSVEVKWVGDE
jgi:hypothetical protein